MRLACPHAAAAALAMFSLLANSAACADAAVRTLSVKEVEGMLGQPGVEVYDADVEELWRKHHLPGAVFIGDHALSGLLPGDKSARLVFYCSGPR